MLEEAAATVAGDSDGARRWERVNHEEAAVGALLAGAGAAARSVGASSVVRENHDAEAHHPRQVDVSVTAEDMAPLPALPASPPAPPSPPPCSGCVAAPRPFLSVRTRLTWSGLGLGLGLGSGSPG